MTRAYRKKPLLATQPEDPVVIPPKKTRRLSLAQEFRKVGDEVVGEDGMTRLHSMIRALYAEAIMGKTSAAEIILERAYGKVPVPIQMDLRTEVTGLLRESGLTLEEARADPLLWEIIQSASIIEGDVKRITAPEPAVEEAKEE